MLYKIKNLEKKYNNNWFWFELKIEDLEIKENDFIFLKWESGSWKSTFLKLIGLMDKEYSWDIFYKDENIRNINITKSSSIRNKDLWFVFQNFQLFDHIWIIDNIAFKSLFWEHNYQELETRAYNLLKEFNLEHILKQKAWMLSWWQIQRISFIRWIFNNPNIVILDEPTSNLDIQNKTFIEEKVIELYKKWKTIIYVDHNSYNFEEKLKRENIKYKNLFFKNWTANLEY